MLIGVGVTVLTRSFAILYSIGTVNKDEMKPAGIAQPSSWADLFNPKLTGHVSIATNEKRVRDRVVKLEVQIELEKMYAIALQAEGAKLVPLMMKMTQVSHEIRGHHRGGWR